MQAKIAFSLFAVFENSLEKKNINGVILLFSIFSPTMCPTVNKLLAGKVVKAVKNTSSKAFLKSNKCHLNVVTGISYSICLFLSFESPYL